LQNHRLIFAQHIASSDTEQEGIADLASSASDGNSYRCFHSGTPFVGKIG